MNLGDIITRLEAADPQQVVPHGFHNPHSYRGDYYDLAFEPVTNITVADMLEAARSAVGATYQGWKGGDFRMNEYDWCWLSEEGTASGETISPLLLQFMLAPAAAQSSADRAVVAKALDDAFQSFDPEHTEDAELVIHLTDAVLAALPPTVDRATVLRDAADAAARFNSDCQNCAVELEVAGELRRLAAEASQPRSDIEKPWLSDGSRIGRALIWSWSDVGHGEFARGYRAAQEQARTLLTGPSGGDTPVQQHHDSDPSRLAAETPQPETQAAFVHIGGNAEDCPACEGTNPPYPFICPGPTTAPAVVQADGEGTS